MLAFIAGVFAGVALAAITVMAAISWFDLRVGTLIGAEEDED